MAKNRKSRRGHGRASGRGQAATAASARRPFDPVPARPRHDGWTPDRQGDFIEALAECGCVAEAAARVGISPSAAYALRRRADAQSFRMAWEAALDHAVQRLSDAAFSRAINGVSRPVFFQGEQIGERRHFDERLTMFILRYRDPVRYDTWLDGCVAQRHPDGPALALARWVNRAHQDAYAAETGDRSMRAQGAGPTLRHYGGAPPAPPPAPDATGEDQHPPAWPWEAENRGDVV